MIKDHETELETAGYANTESILFTTDDMGEAVLIKEVDFDHEESSSSATKAKSAQPQSQFAATSLLQLSQSKSESATEEPETVLLSTDSVIQIPGQEGDYVIVTTDEDEQKLVPISHLSNLIAHAASTPSTSS